MQLQKATIHGNQIWYLSKEEDITKHLDLDLDDLIVTSELIREELRKVGYRSGILNKIRRTKV